jgi:hypothetical protein
LITHTAEELTEEDILLLLGASRPKERKLEKIKIPISILSQERRREVLINYE